MITRSASNPSARQRVPRRVRDSAHDPLQLVTALGHVWRIGDDQVESASALESGEPRSGGDADVRRRPTDAGEVRPGDMQGGLVHVGDPDGGAGRAATRRRAARPIAPEPVPRSATRDRTTLRQMRTEQFEHDLHHHLRLRSRYQHPPVDGEVQAAEPPPPEHVLQRLAGAARPTIASRWATARTVAGSVHRRRSARPRRAARHLAHPPRRAVGRRCAAAVSASSCRHDIVPSSAPSLTGAPQSPTLRPSSVPSSSSIEQPRLLVEAERLDDQTPSRRPAPRRAGRPSARCDDR